MSVCILLLCYTQHQLSFTCTLHTEVTIILFMQMSSVKALQIFTVIVQVIEHNAFESVNKYPELMKFECPAIRSHRVYLHVDAGPVFNKKTCLLTLRQ